MGGEVVLARGGRTSLLSSGADTPCRAWRWARRCAGDGIELVLGIHATAASRDGEEFVLAIWRMDGSCAVTACWWRPDGVRASRGSVWGRLASMRTSTPRRVATAQMRVGERLWAVGDVTGIWQLTHVEGVPEARVVASNILGEPRGARLRGRSRASPAHRSAGRGRRGPLKAEFSAPALLSEVAKTRHLHPRGHQVERVLDAAERRRAAVRRLRAWPGRRRVDAAGDARDPRQGLARRAARHDPAVSELLGDPRRRAESAAPASRSRASTGRHGRRAGSR